MRAVTSYSQPDIVHRNAITSQQNNLLDIGSKRKAKSFSINSDVYNKGGLGYNVNNNTGGDTPMDIEKYIDRLDQDRRDMENRLREDRQQLEDRLDKRFNETMSKIDKMEQLYTEECRLSEQRYTEERRLSEERIDSRFSEAMLKMDNTIARMDKAIDKIDDSKKWITGLSLTTIVGIAAMVLTVVLTIVPR